MQTHPAVRSNGCWSDSTVPEKFKFLVIISDSRALGASHSIVYFSKLLSSGIVFKFLGYANVRRSRGQGARAQCDAAGWLGLVAEGQQ